MKVSKFLVSMVCFISFFSYGGEDTGPQFSDYPVEINPGPFVKKIEINKEQLQTSMEWKSFMQKELNESVNFAGHYRVYISKGGQFLKECGNDGWACGWIIDKSTGYIVSTLPLFNGNTKYHSTTDNGTPSPDAFDATYYPNSSMMLIYGQNNPSDGSGEIKCANGLYDFQNDSFKKISSSECDIDQGDDHE